jgi:hypothetical protein
VVIVDPTAARAAVPISAPGELLSVANRAVTAGERLLVVTPTADTARWARDVLTTPYEQACSDQTTQPYSIPVLIPDDNRGYVVVARDNGRPTWVVDTDGTQQLLAGDRVVASGAVTAPLETLSYETSQLVKVKTQRGERYVVTRPDGTVERFQSLDACSEEYLAVRRPIYPLRPTFVGAMTVAYRDGTSLRRVTMDRTWDQPRRWAISTSELTAALSEFFDRYTGPVPTDTDTPQFGPILETWLNAQVDEQFATRLKSDLPFPDGVTLQRNASGHIVEVDGCGWRIPTTDLPLARANGDLTVD